MVVPRLPGVHEGGDECRLLHSLVTRCVGDFGVGGSGLEPEFRLNFQLQLNR